MSHLLNTPAEQLTSLCLREMDTDLAKSWSHTRLHCKHLLWLQKPKERHCGHVRKDLAVPEQRRQLELLIETACKISKCLHIINLPQTEDPSFRAILPRQMVVFVLMPGCSSLAVFARCRSSSPFIILSESFGTTIRTALTVCSRTNGATSLKPVT